MTSANSLHSASIALLAFDTSTEIMSIAVTNGNQTWQHTAQGGAKTSAALIPAIMSLLKEANVSLQLLDAIAFGRGPGSFTGLRTACSVAQGLAFGAGDILVLPVDTLLATAEEARFSHGATQVHAVLDARMGEVYSASYDFNGGDWQTHASIQLCRPDQLQLQTGYLFAGNIMQAQGSIHALPTATAMLRLAPAMLAAGLGVSADQALPLYVRDKVAQTTAERAALKSMP
jgi:tRNA threonylcarbamoyladenosine biosynthesis protein TsaB